MNALGPIQKQLLAWLRDRDATQPLPANRDLALAAGFSGEAKVISGVLYKLAARNLITIRRVGRAQKSVRYVTVTPRATYTPKYLYGRAPRRPKDPLPPISRAAELRLQAEHIARRGVTHCPGFGWAARP